MQTETNPTLPAATHAAEETQLLSNVHGGLDPRHLDSIPLNPLNAELLTEARSEVRKVNVEPLCNLLHVCKGQALSRFVHMSSLGVYAARHHYGTDESESLPARHSDGYSQSKVEAEQLALRYYRDLGVPVVVLRPGFVYGPRDRTVMPRTGQTSACRR